ncbi:MAG: hypothetical protein ACRDVE_18055 [Actinocrinis sp.]
MKEFTEGVDLVEKVLADCARHPHVRARRFLTAYVPTLITALIVAGPHLTSALIISAALSAAVTVLGELDPSIPWSMVAEYLDALHFHPPVTPPQSPAAGASSSTRPTS